MAELSFPQRIRDALFKHLTPPFVGLVTTATVGPLAGVLATGTTAAVAERFTTHEEIRRADFRISEIAHNAIGELADFIESEWPYRERNRNFNPDAAASALASVLASALENNAFLTKDLDREIIIETLLKLAPSSLSDGEKRLFELGLPKAVDASLAIFSQHEEFSQLASREILIRLTDLRDDIAQIVRDVISAARAAEASGGDIAFETRYRKALGHSLNRLELFGIQDKRIEYPLQLAFVALRLSSDEMDEVPAGANAVLDGLSPGRGRLLITGEAGAGKSTLLQWVAITAAYNRYQLSRRRFAKTTSDYLEDYSEAAKNLSSSFLGNYTADLNKKSERHTEPEREMITESVRDNSPQYYVKWIDKVPFFLRLRDLESGRLPRSGLNCFLDPLAILGTPPENFVAHTLEAGKGLILLDGVDEVEPVSRRTLKRTIDDLCSNYSNENYILVTTRPEAAEEGWLTDLGFREAGVEPLTSEQKDLLINQWFSATARSASDEDDAESHTLYMNAAHRMRVKLREVPALNRIAANPLLCALLCAYSQLGQEFIPEKPHDIARELSELILERRDRERGIQQKNYAPAYRELGYENKRALTERIAYHMMENGGPGGSDSYRKDIANLVADYISKIPKIGRHKAEEVLRGLVERSGMLKELAPDRLGFIHNFFKEYHASAEYVRRQDFEKLARKGYEASVRPAVIFAASRDEGTSRIIQALLNLQPIDWPRFNNNRFERERDLLALQCGATGRPHDYISELIDRRRALFPPQSMREAKSLADLGDEAVPFLRYDENKNVKARETAACIRALGLIGTRNAYAALENYVNVDTKTAAYELATHIDPFSINRLRADVFHGRQLPRRIQRQIRDISLITQYPGLEEINLEGTRVKNFKPLSDMTDLVRINLNNTSISDLSILAEHTHLEELLLDHTSISDISALSRLPNLKRLDLDGTDVRDISPLAELRLLEVLHLNYLGIEDISHVAELVKLHTLWFVDSKVKDISPLLELANLIQLNMDSAYVENLSSIVENKVLEWLDIDNTQVSDISPLAELRSLQYLSAIGTKVLDLSPLENLNCLTSLYLSSTPISDISPLSRMHNLETIFLSNTQVSDVSALSNLPDLRTLNLVNTEVKDLTPLTSNQKLAVYIEQGNGHNRWLTSNQFEEFSSRES